MLPGFPHLKLGQRERAEERRTGPSHRRNMTRGSVAHVQVKANPWRALARFRLNVGQTNRVLTPERPMADFVPITSCNITSSNETSSNELAWRLPGKLLCTRPERERPQTFDEDARGRRRRRVKQNEAALALAQLSFAPNQPMA